MDYRSRNLTLLLILLCFCIGCANVGTLTGGKKDTTPPQLVSVSPRDSLLNTRVTKIELRFDEYVALNNLAKEIQVSPLLALPPIVTNVYKRVTVKIPDSLLLDNTTYRITFGSAIKDIHEENKFTGYSYIFSTGGYFDSLEINGNVINARTGLPDSAAFIVLHKGSSNDSAIVRERPQYVTKVDPNGSFSLKGLPSKQFRIYALTDANDNLIYDGGSEKIAFIENIITPGDTSVPPIVLRTFEEMQDTSLIDSAATAVQGKEGKTLGRRSKEVETETDEFLYTVGVDTSDLKKRTKEITAKPVEIVFTQDITTFDSSRINLSYDSAEVSVEAPIMVRQDTARSNVLLVNSDWKEDRIYTLRLLKGFVKDSAGVDAMPSRYSFRTKRDDDYARLNIHLPAKYHGNKYIFLVTADKDTVYNKPVVDTTVSIVRLQPGAYSMRVIIDENENGVWDTGDLFLKRQPEMVVPYESLINLKAGWDNMIDFESAAGLKDQKATSPGKRDKETRK